jgi:hypothetical protein
VSAGRDYSPLFDALGTSPSPYLSQPLTIDDGKRFNFTGITNVDNYARLSLALSVVMQAARYVRFRLGFLLSHATAHGLDSAAPCSELKTSGEASTDCGDRAANALHRPVIDLPGQRFSIAADLAYDLSATATAQF